MKKYMWLIITLGLLILVSIVLLFMIKRRVYFESYSKYNSSITLVKEGNEVKRYIIDTFYDNNNLRFSVNEKEAYIVNKDLYYMDGNTIYKTDIGPSYVNVYNILSSLKKIEKIEEKENRIIYNTDLSKSEVKELCEALLIETNIDEGAKASLMSEDKKIISFRMKINDIQIDIKFNELENDFRVDTSFIYNNNNNPGLMKNIEKTDTNPFIIR